jgi:hypothetical protein
MRRGRQHVAESDAGTSAGSDAYPDPDTYPDTYPDPDAHADTHTDAGRHGIHDYFQRRVATIADRITRYARDIHQQRQPSA